MKKLALSMALGSSLLVVGVASAEDKTAVERPTASVAAPASREPKLRGVIELPPTEITSPPMRPLATIDVTRMQPRLTLFVLRQAFLSRIEESVFSDRF